MDLTPEEKAALRELLARIRQVGEDFTHVHINRILSRTPEYRLSVLSAAIDGGEILLSSFAANIALLDEPEEVSAFLAIIEAGKGPTDRLEKEIRFKAECFRWAAGRCLGEAFTPEMREGHRKLVELMMLKRGIKARTPQEANLDTP